MQLKVGQLAKRTGISVKTLHHYDEIGLLSPSSRTASAHRLYIEADIMRLQQIMSLRSLGFALEEIRKFLDAPERSPLQVLEMHLEVLKQELSERQKLIDSLQTIVSELRSGENPGVDELLNLIEDTTMFQKYYSQEQLDRLAERAKMLGPEKIKGAENEWTVLIEEVRIEMQKGTDPKSEVMQELARRWQNLIAMFTGGDPAIANSLATMYREEGAAKASRGALDDDVSAFMAKALARE